jgi:hypothetical protein
MAPWRVAPCLRAPLPSAGSAPNPHPTTAALAQCRRMRARTHTPPPCSHARALCRLCHRCARAVPLPCAGGGAQERAHTAGRAARRFSKDAPWEGGESRARAVRPATPQRLTKPRCDFRLLPATPAAAPPLLGRTLACRPTATSQCCPCHALSGSGGEEGMQVLLNERSGMRSILPPPSPCSSHHPLPLPVCCPLSPWARPTSWRSQVLEQTRAELERTLDARTGGLNKPLALRSGAAVGSKPLARQGRQAQFAGSSRSHSVQQSPGAAAGREMQPPGSCRLEGAGQRPWH